MGLSLNIIRPTDARAIKREHGVGDLFSVGTNAKTIKSDRANRGFLTAIMYLTPAGRDGAVNLCPWAGSCKEPCLNLAGRGQMDSVQVARRRRTDFFALDRSRFRDVMACEISALERRAWRLGLRLAVRPDGTSDVPWESVASEIFGHFANVQFYDYTKGLARALRHAAGDFPTNYHLTFSRQAETDAESARVLAAGGNVAAVFEDAPSAYLGAPVIDGNEHDLRFLDPSPVVVALKPKGPAKRDASGFVIRPADLIAA